MSMISNLIENLEEMVRWNELTDKPRAEAIQEAIDTIKDLSAKLRAANMERSKIYYDGDKDVELLDREEVLGTLDEMCVVDGVYRALASLPVIVGKPYPAKEGSGKEQNEP